MGQRELSTRHLSPVSQEPWLAVDVRMTKSQLADLCKQLSIGKMQEHIASIPKRALLHVNPVKVNWFLMQIHGAVNICKVKKNQIHACIVQNQSELPQISVENSNGHNGVLAWRAIDEDTYSVWTGPGAHADTAMCSIATSSKTTVVLLITSAVDTMSFEHLGDCLIPQQSAL